MENAIGLYPFRGDLAYMWGKGREWAEAGNSRASWPFATPPKDELDAWLAGWDSVRTPPDSPSERKR